MTTATVQSTAYDRRKEYARRKQAEQALAGRDIGPPPPIADTVRRFRGRESLRFFCETYNPAAFDLAWSADHLKAIARIEEAAIYGALYAFAMPRGQGKTALCRMSALWAVAYGWRRYVFIIGATEPKAVRNLAAVKTFIRFLPLFKDDFPEIAHAVAKLNNIANRASGQICNGNPTMIGWEKNRIVFPTVPVPENWPSEWTTADGGMAPTSGSLIGVSGLTGEGIRGSVDTTMDGGQLRPDFVLLDDPQTDESAKSPQQNHDRESLIAGAVLGMAGPGKTISAVMPCTVIRKGDMADSTLDRDKHPLWRGERTKLLRSMPKNMDAWERYFDEYRACALKEPPDFAESNAYYRDHRAELDEGAEASWEARCGKNELSAIQSAMHLYCRNPVTFFAEYQNEPVDEAETTGEEITPGLITSKCNGFDRGLVPMWAQYLDVHIDVQGSALFWMASAWSQAFDGAIVDYGVYPDQRRRYVTLREVRKTLMDAAPGSGQEGSIYAGLDTLVNQLMSRQWPREDGGVQRLNLCLIDANWGKSTNVVYQFCRQSPHSASLLPAHGQFFGASGRQWDHKRKVGEWMGLHCRVPPVKGRRLVHHVLFDTNFWKSFVAARFHTAMGDHGGLTVFGNSGDDHRMLIDNLTSERPYQVDGRERTATEWRLEPNRDNHLWDNLVACAVGACRMGATLAGTLEMNQRKRRKVKASEIQRQRMGK